MTYGEYLKMVKRVIPAVPEWRAGQCAFNSLWKVRPDLAELVSCTSRDPFYNDGRLVEFYAWLERNWDAIQ